MDLLKQVIAYLKKAGGAAPKVQVEDGVFEQLKGVLGSPYYSDLVGGGVLRWRKNVQFARNTGCRMGLIKDPGQAGRGIWALTDKGLQWKFE